MKPYPRVDDLLRPILGVAMPRAGRLYAPGGTVHVVARCNNREFSFTTPGDFEVLLDRNPVRAGLVEDPATDPWSSCAAYALGTPSRLITFHPSYLALSPYPKVRQRHYHTLLLPNPDPRLDARDPRWTSQRAVGSVAFLTRYLPRHARRRSVPVPPHIQVLGA